jgi:hypothetical protein
LLGGQPLSVRVNARQRHARLDPTLHFNQGDLHIRGTGQLRLVALQLPELGDFLGFGSRRTRRALVHTWNCTIDVRRMPARRTALPPTAKSALIIGSEALPFSKTGGLADVLGALPSAIARLGWAVTLVVPRYRGVVGRAPAATIDVRLGGQALTASFFEEPLDGGGRAILVDAPDLYDREGLYHVHNVDYADNALRFAFLARAAFEFTIRTGVRPTVVHVHDWQAALAPVYLKTRPCMRIIRCLAECRAC